MIPTARLILDIALSIALLVGSAPLLLLLGVVGVFRHRGFWEFLVFGFLFELLYGVGAWSLPFPFPMFIGSGLLFIGVELIRKKLR
jgi:hypothetical protein